MQTNGSKDKSAVVLLSGGLDSVVSLASVRETCKVKKLLFFNYGQKAFEKEYKASLKIADYYDLSLDVIELEWLKNITKTALVADTVIPDISESDLSRIDLTIESKNKVWVPNRNGLFVNIAAAYADSYEYDYVVIGANKEEAATFSDNSQEFIDNVNLSLKKSVNYPVKVIAPLIDKTKNDIIELAIKLDVPLQYINSCYNNTEKHCGRCESCNRLRRALENNRNFSGVDELISKLFG